MLQLSLLLMRLTVFLVMFMWTIDKLVNPGHAAKVYESFYYISGLGANVMYAIGTIEIVVLVLFLVGYKKKYTYGEQKGFMAGHLFTNPSTGKYISITLWETEEDMVAGDKSGYLKEQLGKIAAHFAEPPVIEQYVYAAQG